MASYTVEVELSGRGNGWTTLTDVIHGTVDFTRGFGGGMVTDAVMDSGTLTFQLDNSPQNSARTVGYYSPDHASCRPGFKESIWVRLSVTAGATVVRRFTGILDKIAPAPGKYGQYRTFCAAVSWLETASYTRLDGAVPVQLNKRGDEIVTTLLATLPSSKQPRATQFDAGKDSYPYVLDRVRDEQTRLREELYRVAISGLDKIWERGDGTLVFESRTKRFSVASSIDTFTDHHGFNPNRSQESIVNSAQFTVNPRLIGTPDSTMFELTRTVEIAPGETVEIIGTWTDPANPDVRVGAVDLTTPVSGTDYRINSLEDGTGTDLLPYVTLTLGLSGNATSFTFALSPTAPSPGFITYVRQRGTPLLVYNPPILSDEDATSVLLNGTRSYSVNLPYQDDLILGKEAAQYLVFTRKAAKTEIVGFTRVVSMGAHTELLRSVQRELSDRVTVIDAVSGINGAFFINSIREVYGENVIATQWNLSPADSTSYFRLDDAVRGELDAGNRLNFGYILGHTDVAHADEHGDSAHTDVVHSDVAHSDAAHGDTAHGDGAGHTDDAFVDIPHGDSAHSDTAHSDTHGDVAHADSPHYDAHYDVAHSDGPAFPEELHDDVPHEDSHDDTAHDDTSHTDTHSDVAHSDAAHADYAHTDEAHEDSSSHADYAHSDSAHGDTAHTDVSHSDVAHSDYHYDAAHGDVN